jgi:tetratricopeptide (TPR) repeat protein
MSASSHPLVLQARAAFERGDVATATAAAESLLKLDARDLQALQLRYLVQHRQGKLKAATETLRAVIAIDPRADWAYNGLIQLLMSGGRRSDAEQLARIALRVNPRNAHAHHFFGTLLSELNDLPSGEWHFRRALELAPGEAAAVLNLAINLMKQGRTAEAEEMFKRADSLAPRDVTTLAHWSKLYEVQGDMTRAGELLDRAAAVSSPEHVNLLRTNYLARTGHLKDALAILDAAPALNGDARLERGRINERLGRYHEAWVDFTEGKRRLAAEGGNLEYRAEAVDTFFARLKKFFVRANVQQLPRAAVRAELPQPVFVVGFPRSGTTLLEQVLASHSRVRAGGELAFVWDFRRLANSLFHGTGAEPFPENLARTWTADNAYAATLFRDYYFARAEQYGLLESGKSFFVDKMPFNEIWLPLIRMAFPRSPIVHVIRHPLDVCVSVMANHLTHGFHCGYRIEDIVHHFAAVFGVIEHYRHELDIGELELRYESFVADQAAETRRLLAHLDLEFEESCLSFHETRRYAPTPSYAQVTEKLNDRSIGRHRHYAAHLKPFLPQLAPLMARYGYQP